jgi:hypothetical protein
MRTLIDIVSLAEDSVMEGDEDDSSFLRDVDCHSVTHGDTETTINLLDPNNS